MGNSCIKCENGDSVAGPQREEIIDSRVIAKAVDVDSSDMEKILRENQQMNLNRLREQLKNDPASFVLNNVTLAVSFFENFDRDKEAIKACRNEREISTARSLADVRRKCLYEGALPEIVGLKHRYLARGAGQPEVIGRLRHVLLYDNLEVHPEERYDSLVNKDYSSLGERVYRFCIEDDDSIPGYVMLRCVDSPRRRLPPARLASITGNGAGDSDGYSKLSDYGSHNASARQSSSSNDDVEDTSNTNTQDAEERTDPQQVDTQEKTLKKRINKQNSRNRFQRMQPRKDSGIFPRNVPYPVLKRKMSTTLDKIGEEVEVSSHSNGRTRSHIDLTDNRISNSSSTKELHKSKSDPSFLSDYSSEDDYGYSRIDDIARPLVCRKERPRDSSIPEECFRSIKVKMVADDESDPFEIDSQYEARTYLSSKVFIETFADAFCDWGHRIGITNMEQATVVRARVLCTETKNTPPPDYSIHEEFIPGIPMPFWPKCAFEWVHRKRVTVRDVRTNIAYTWPIQRQIQSIVEMGCNLSAEGSRIEGKFTPYADLQWAICFGKAEGSLLSSMTQAHLSCYTWAQLILKDALASLGVVTPYHIKTILFWLVEKNFVDWPMEALGSRLRAIFDELYHALRRKRLPHYFIRRRNLFRSKPRRDLLKAQEKVFRVLENFLPVVIHAARRLQSNRQTFPLPDFARLWEILTVESSLGNMRKELLLATADKPRPPGVEASDGGFWSAEHKNRLKLDPFQEKMRKERARREAAAAAIAAKRKERSKSSESVDSINTDTPIQNFDVPRVRMILQFFIEHFLKMTRRSNEFRAYSNSTIFINHTENLAKLMEEVGFSDEAAVYAEQLDLLRHAARAGPLTAIPGLPGVSRPLSQSLMDLKSPTLNKQHTGSNWELRKETPLPELPLSNEIPVKNGKPAFARPEVLKTLNSIQQDRSSHIHGEEESFSDLSPPSPTDLDFPKPASKTFTVQASIESHNPEPEPEHDTTKPSTGHQIYISSPTLFLSDAEDLDDSTDF